MRPDEKLTLQVLIAAPTHMQFLFLLWLRFLQQKYRAKFHVSTTGLHAIQEFCQYHPALVLIDCELPDIHGMSLASILKDEKDGGACIVLLTNAGKCMRNTKADRCFERMPQNKLRTELMSCVRQALAQQRLQEKSGWTPRIEGYGEHAAEVAAAVSEQYGRLPPRIDAGKLRVECLFSPFDNLSGDGLDYWTAGGERFYGMVFDYVGHNLMSAINVGQIRTLLKISCRQHEAGFFKSLNEVMEDVNSDLFDLSPDPTPTAAVVFCLDFSKGVLRYCPAGIPSFYVRRSGAVLMEGITLRSYRLGYEEDIAYEEHCLELDGIEEVMFTSDGLSELLFRDRISSIAKHDDVAAILMSLGRK